MNNLHNPQANLLFFLVSTLFFIGCSEKSDGTVEISKTINFSQNKVIKNFDINTDKGTYFVKYIIIQENRNGLIVWSGNVEITDKSQNIKFELPHKSTVEEGDIYKHTFKDTKDNKLLFTTDTNLVNPVLDKYESYLFDITFS